MPFFKQSFHKRIDRANQLFRITIEKLERTIIEIEQKIEKNKQKEQKLLDENRELGIMKEKTSFLIKEISKFTP